MSIFLVNLLFVSIVLTRIVVTVKIIKFSSKRGEPWQVKNYEGFHRGYSIAKLTFWSVYP